jgi:hypothetical protein
MVGQLVLIAYIFQIGAFDHWVGSHGVDLAHYAVEGVPGSSEHVIHDSHCHGDVSSCADAGAGFTVFAANQNIHLPPSMPSLAVTADFATTAPQEVHVGTLLDPPRLAA